jgi:ZIP family zinc transporter
MEFIQQNHFLTAILATLIAGFGATTLGAIPVLVLTKLSEKINNALLSFAAGVMLAATVFSLLIPSVEAAKQNGLGNTSAILQAIFGLCVGGLAIWLINEFVPHEHFFGKGQEGVKNAKLKRIWLFVIAIAIHNFPEGLSVGVATGTGEFSTGFGATLGIALQNIPEGLSVAVALHSQGYSRTYALFIAALTGLVEPFGGAFGAGILAISSQILPFALAFAGGSMLFIVSDEIIPETHRLKFGSSATAALFVGFGVMMFLDSVFAK